MDREMFDLAERLVIAMETMSQDVKNISAYVYDLSCSVSYLLKDKREKESSSVLADDEVGNPLSVSASAAGQEASADGQYEQAVEGSATHIGVLEHGESYFRDIASTDIDFHENIDNKRFCTEGIKPEEQADAEVNDESCDMYVMYDNSRNLDSDSVAQMQTIPEWQSSTYQMESTEDASLVHSGVNIDDKSYKCSVCKKSFKSHYLLRRHTRVHTGERPYKCNVCGKTFSVKSTVNVHMRTHTGEKPYMCTLCGKSFRHRNVFTQHMHTHSAEQSYE